MTNEDLDGIYIATPWEWHHPMAMAAMENDIHVGTEVPSCINGESMLGFGKYF